MHDRSSTDGDRRQPRDRNGGLPTRIDPETGDEQVLLQGALGGYWQYRSRVTIDETGYGQHTDWD